MAQKLSRTIHAWCSYDIANSVYKLLITTVLFPIYYNAVTDNTLHVFSFTLNNTVLYDYALSAAYLVIAFVSPLLSGIADYGHHKKKFMKFFTFVGSFSCMGLFFFTGDNLLLGIALIMFAAIGYEGAALFYDSFLPLIAPKRIQDKISAKGYSWGYSGSMVLLALNLILIMNYDMNIRYSFLQVGLWWFSIAWIAFIFLSEEKKKPQFNTNSITQGYKELMGVKKKIFSNEITKGFLLSFFFYSMGLQTLMLVAILFGKSEIGIGDTELIITVLILQFVAIIGALFFAYISRKYGNKQSLMSMLCICVLICTGGYLVETVFQFYIVSAGVGLIMGGIQSLSRSTFSKLIPNGSDDTASHFSFYNFTEKIAIVIGMFSFGFIEHSTGNPRNSTIALGLFFIIALIIMWRTPLNTVKELH